MGNSRRAVTLIEVLVAMAIVAILVGLFFPAVQKIRAASYQKRCANNLRQLALAAHHYHDTHGALPTGCSYDAGRATEPHMSWLTRLLPYIEQDALWQSTTKAYAQNQFFLAQPHHAVHGQVMLSFLCPADERSHEPVSLAGTRIAFTDYLGVWGDNYRDRAGVLFLDSRVRFAEVTDGTSTTLMIGERPPNPRRNLGWWYAGWGQARDGSAEMVLGVREYINSGRVQTACPYGPYRFEAGTDSECDAYHFWSRHVGGGHFAFCDGSVKFLRYGADSVLHALATRAGGETADVP